MKKTYIFKDVWYILAEPEAFLTVFKDVSQWPQWWPGLKRVTIVRFNEAITGSQAVMVWRAPVGYELKFQIDIDGYEPGKRITFQLSGDVVGSGSWSLQKSQPDIVLCMLLKAQTTKRWMNILSPILRPVFIKAHDILMQRGEAGLNRQVKK